MSIFSKQVALAKEKASEEAKRIALKPRLLRHPDVKAAFNLLPAKVRKDATLSLSTYGNVVFISMVIHDLDKRLHERRTQQGLPLRQALH